MVRPWQIWLTFAACLIVVLLAMGWLSIKVLQLNRTAAEARAEAELEQEIGLALWRMDTALTPILAFEAARPYFLYEPLLPSNTKGGESVPSPLTQQPSEFVRLNFQVDADGHWTSPQCPPEIIEPTTAHVGLQRDKLVANTKLLEELEATDSARFLFENLPKELLSQVTEISDTTSQAFPVETADRQQESESDTTAMPQGQAGQEIPQASNNQIDSQIAQDLYEYGRRNEALQNLSRVAVEQQRALTSNNLWYAPDPTVLEGVSVPIWVDNKLLFVRRVNIGGSEVIQGCWFDWSALREWLLEPARERLPDVDLVAVADREPQSHRRMLASLPVALTVPLPHLIQTGSDPMAWALGAAWACLLIATIAVGALLQGVIRLSERRAQFVSAVTHELRTPLTTFRMYSEMLLQNMIEDPEKKRSYLQTLNEEADRLTHLVENVLSYARLERGSASMHLETLTASRLIEHSRARLEERAREANMDFECSLPTQADSIAIHTNVSAVEQILFNLVENACKYACHGSDPVIQMEAKIAAQQLEISIQDFGPGIPADEKRRLFRPFHKSSEEAARSAPGVGLGLALSRRLARDLGGNLRLDHHATSGARFCLSLPLAPSNEKTNFSGIIGE